jgi:hypothetical protein
MPLILDKGLPNCIESCLKYSLCTDPKDRRLFEDLYVILFEGKKDVARYSSGAYDLFIKAEESIDEDVDSSINSGRVLDSKGNIIAQRVMHNTNSSEGYSMTV